MVCLRTCHGVRGGGEGVTSTCAGDRELSRFHTLQKLVKVFLFLRGRGTAEESRTGRRHSNLPLTDIHVSCRAVDQLLLPHQASHTKLLLSRSIVHVYVVIDSGVLITLAAPLWQSAGQWVWSWAGGG